MLLPEFARVGGVHNFSLIFMHDSGIHLWQIGGDVNMPTNIRTIGRRESDQLIRLQPLYERTSAEEDEINLLDLLIVLLRHKFLIIGMTLVAGIGALVTTSGRERVYRSEATIAPRAQETTKFYGNHAGGDSLSGIMEKQLSIGGSGSQQEIVINLNCRKLAGMVVEKYKLMPILFAEGWDSDKDKWKIDASPTLQDGINVLQGMLKVDVPRKATGTIKVGFVNKDPAMAKRFVDYYLTTLSESMREEVLRDRAENRRFLEKQLERIRDPLIVEKIYALLAAEIEKDTFARGQKFFGFRIIDPPLVPDLNKSEPTHRRRTLQLSVVVAFFLAVFLAFIIEYVRGLKTRDQERYKELVEELKVWKIKRD